MTELQELPPGWESRYDPRSSKFYYINHYTKMTTWEDPRQHQRSYDASKHFTNVPVEHIPLQHGSPDLKRNYVYPSHPCPIPAFQMPGRYSPKSIPLQEVRLSRASPLSVRGSRIQDSSLTTVSDTDEATTKIRAMFPTVSDTHIRLLLKKYHNREAVVISALQVEKHPITTPGPFATPPPIRNIQHPGIQAHLQMTPPLGVRTGSRVNSPILRSGSGASSGNYTGSPHIGRSHSSPKLKLRYMKSIFPQADETVILEILSNNENNIQKASDALKEMGFQKKDTVKVAKQQAEAKAEQIKQEEIKKARPPTPPPKLKSIAEKVAIKAKLQDKYEEIEERVIMMALESADFDAQRATQILELTVQEEKQKKEEIDAKTEIQDEITKMDSLTVNTISVSQSRQSIKSLLKSEKAEKTMFNRIIEANDRNSDIFKSSYLSPVNGTKLSLAKGPNDKLLLEDYIKWQGPNLSLRQGPNQSLVKGPNPLLRLNCTYQARGPNADLRKGPKCGLAKGSIFQQFKGLVVGESRGK